MKKSTYCKRVTLFLSATLLMLIGFQNCMDSDFDGQNRMPDAVSSVQTTAFDPSDFNLLQSIVAGSDHTCSILGSEDESVEGGLVKCWGRNDFGQLGSDQIHQNSQDNNTSSEEIFVDLGTGHTAKAIAAGDKHTCVILNTDQVKCWGANDYGQLGLGDASHRGADLENEMGDNLPYVDLGSDHTANALFARYNYTCAILDNDRLKCWGDNGFGQLGLEDIDARGDELNEMGDDLPYVDLGDSHLVKDATLGKNHTCAILDSDRLKCWGINNFGQLGLGDDVSRGDDVNEMGDDLPYVDLGLDRAVKSMTAGDSYTCAILDNDRLKCWGINHLFGLTASINYLGDEADEMGDQLEYVQLGDDRMAHFVTGGPYHICLTLDSGQVKCWGKNDRGQLGLGDVDYRGDGDNEGVDRLPFVNLGTDRSAEVLVAGDKHTCGILDDNKIKCWGSNEYHQLWLNDTEDHRGDSPNEMGDNLPYIDL